MEGEVCEACQGSRGGGGSGHRATSGEEGTGPRHRGARYIKKGRNILRARVPLKYGFIRAHRCEFSVTSMCRVLMVHVRGFYAWLKEPLSQRTQDDERQTELIRQAWGDSGNVYGYRTLHATSQGRTSANTSRCSTIPNANTRTTACCRPFTSKQDSKTGRGRCLGN